MTPELLIMLGILIAARERKGAKWCEKNGVGRVRKIVGMALPPAEIANGAVASYAETQRTAAGILESECRRCRGCGLGRE